MAHIDCEEPKVQTCRLAACRFGGCITLAGIWCHKGCAELCSGFHGGFHYTHMQPARVCVYAGERRSRRARKNRQPVQASSMDTLATLRLKVFEVLSVHPRNQRLYVRGQLLSGEDDTLAKVRGDMATGCVVACQRAFSFLWHLHNGVPSRYSLWQ